MAAASFPERSAAERLDALLEALAEIYAAEGRPGGDVAAAALRAARGRPFAPPGAPLAIAGEIARALALSPAHEVIDAVRAAADLLPWYYPGLADGRIRPDVSLATASVELVGPNGMIPAEGVRVGLFVQGPRHEYPTRTHAAEETFFIIAGTALWQAGDAPPAPHPPGSYVFHASNLPHASVTRDEPVLAAWRWTGEVGRESYRLHG